MPRPRSKSRYLAFVLIGVFALLAACLLAGPIWLPSIGHALVLSGGDALRSNATADVLAIPGSPWISGSIASDRALFASDWIRQGRAKLVVMTCGPVYGVSGCELAQKNLAAHGLPKLPLRAVVMPSSPSSVEAAALMAEVERTRAATAIVLVNPLESRRVSRIYQAEAARRHIKITVLYLPDPSFHVAKWWRDREGQKAVVFELSQWIGIP